MTGEVGYRESVCYSQICSGLTVQAAQILPTKGDCMEKSRNLQAKLSKDIEQRGFSAGCQLAFCFFFEPLL